jgi:hypothetical protein
MCHATCACQLGSAPENLYRRSKMTNLPLLLLSLHSLTHGPHTSASSSTSRLHHWRTELLYRHLWPYPLSPMWPSARTPHPTRPFSSCPSTPEPVASNIAAIVDLARSSDLPAPTASGLDSSSFGTTVAQGRRHTASRRQSELETSFPVTPERS